MKKSGFNTICICGGGALGHVVAGFISEYSPTIKVNMLTPKSHMFSSSVTIETCDGLKLTGRFSRVSNNPADVIADADVVLLCLPGFLIKEELLAIRGFLKPDAYVGAIFSSTGFFFEAKQWLSENQPLWGFQRVPFISRVKEYGKSAALLGYKSSHRIAVENVPHDEKIWFCQLAEKLFGAPVFLLKNYLEASLTNSNPILHTARLYSMFKDWEEGVGYKRNILFYEEWTNYSSEILIAMDNEFFKVLSVLPVSEGYIPRLLDYYESCDAISLTAKLSSIQGFKGIYSPMKEVVGMGWVPDFQSRYFVEDFLYGLRYIYELAREHGVEVETINSVYEWGVKNLKKQQQ